MIVPIELLESVIFALDMFVRVLIEGEETQLRIMGHIFPHQKAKDASYLMVWVFFFVLISVYV